MTKIKNDLKLGAFSISLAVKDLAASKNFYSKLGFVQVGGEIKQKWLILRNGEATLGLFQGMFEGNVLTFNPGWDAQNNELNTYTDVREIKQHLVANDIQITAANLDSDSGPGHISLVDPDGNAVLIDQHL